MPPSAAPTTEQTLQLAGQSCRVHALPALAARLNLSLARLPYSIRVLLENLARHRDGETVTDEHIALVARYQPGEYEETEIAFHPSRVLMPDSSGLPLLVDLASMRDRVAELGQDPTLINPLVPVDFVVDHSTQVDHAGSADALVKNLTLEYKRNRERYEFLKWGAQAFRNLRIIPPGNGILHQINVEHLAQVVRVEPGADGVPLLSPDSLVGMDSHTPMVNSLGVFGWGVGGIEAGSAMLGEPISMVVPQVVGCRLVGRLAPGVTGTDLVLTVTQRLRQAGVVGQFVEFCGPGLDQLPLPDRATVANMAPEYGATMGFFPVDAATVAYLRTTGRPAEQVALVEAYCRAQGLWREGPEPAFTRVVEIDLAQVVPSLAGPRRPDERIDLPAVPANFEKQFAQAAPAGEAPGGIPAGAVAIAAITSCTNTSNPRVLVAAGLLARNAIARGLRAAPWVKTSLSPGSRRVSDYLAASGLDQSLDALGFQVTGYGCMTCMGGGGELKPEVAQAVQAHKTVVAAVLSGNRNFESRIHPDVRANYLASPPLVVAYAIAGTVRTDIHGQPLGHGADGQPVYLRDIWPADEEVDAVIERFVVPQLYVDGYARLGDGDAMWNGLFGGEGATLRWDAASNYIRRAPYGDRMGVDTPPAPIEGARILAMLGDNITTDHISPVGPIPKTGSVADYLQSRGLRHADMGMHISWRANPDVVARTTLANLQLRNELVPGVEGGMTRHLPSGETMRIFEAAMRYREEGTALVIVAGVNYGAGSSRDTAAKGSALIGVRAVIAESFERIHRTNLVGVGVLPLQFPAGVTRKTLGLDGSERVTLIGSGAGMQSRMRMACRFDHPEGRSQTVELQLRVDTPREMRWIASGGILPYAGNGLLQRQPAATHG